MGTRLVIMYMHAHLDGSPGVVHPVSPVLARNLGKVLLGGPMLSAVVLSSIGKHLCNGLTLASA